MKYGESVTVERKYKDTLFRMLFSDKKELLKLYNAANGSSYTNEEELEIVTLENAIYMNMKNDLAFVMDFYLHLYEHQSSYNPNMPLRNLFYVAREYESMVEKKSLYSSRLAKIPAPRFLVFYNGTDRMPEKTEFRLSDAYYTREEHPELELTVTMLNINTGNNVELQKQCDTLRQYSLYVDRVREYKKTGLSLQESVERAVDECIREGILEEFLRKNKAEAISMSIFEYNEEWEKEKLRKAEYEAGVESGFLQGMETGIQRGSDQQLFQGIDNLVINLKLSLQEACDALGVTMEQYERAKEQTLEKN